MRKLFVSLAALLVISLAGCAHHRHGHPGRGLHSSNPQVSIEGDQIRLSQEVLVFAPGVTGPVTWSLPANSPFRFPDNGIVIEGRLLDQVIRGKPVSVALDPDQKEIVDCKASRDGLQFTCFNKHTMPGVYKYTIRVKSGDKLLERDPPAVNM